MPQARSRPLSGNPAPGDRERWSELLDRLDVEELSETFLNLVSVVPGYDPGPIPRSELRRSAGLSFRALIGALRAGGFDEVIPISVDVGVSRARAGIALTSLMTAIRHDFTVLWEALARVSNADDAELFVRHLGIVLRTVDEYVEQTQRAYIAERERMREDEASVRQGLIAALFQEPRPTGQYLTSIAGKLGLPLGAPLVVIAGMDDDIARLRVAISEFERAGVQVFTHHLGDTLIAFTRRFDRPGPRVDELGRRLRSLRVGIACADGGLSGLRGTSATARELAALLTSGEEGAMTWDRGWARLASKRLLISGMPILADVQAALATCGEAERTRLEAAVRSYLRTGNISASSHELFCHRNTLANRLRRFAELTGVDPAVPEQAARLVVGWA